MKAVEYVTCPSSGLRPNGGFRRASGVAAPPSAPRSDERREGRPSAPADLSLIYESRDRRFCLFEFGGGHLAAVDALRLA